MTLFTLFVSLVIWGLIFYILWWGLDKMALPEPFNKIATVILVIATIIVLVGILTGSISPFPFLSTGTKVY